MAIFIIILDDPSETAWQAVRKHWPNGSHHLHSDQVAFISATKLTLTKSVAEKLGIIKGDAWGLVIELKHYSGYADRTLVEWLDKSS